MREAEPPWGRGWQTLLGGDSGGLQRLLGGETRGWQRMWG